MVARGNVTTGAPATAAAFQITLPTHATGDRLILVVTGKYNTTTVPTINQSWTLVGSGTGGTGATGADVGQTFWAVYAKDATSGAETAPTVTPGTTAPDSWEWICTKYSPGAGKAWRDSIGASAAWVTAASDATTASPLTGTSGTVMPTAGDAYFAVGVIPTDLGTALGTTTLTATGLSGGTKDTTTTNYIENALGGDTAAVWSSWEGFTGTATAGLAMSFTVTGATNQSGSLVAIVIREQAGAASPTGIASGEAFGTPTLVGGDINFIGVATGDYTATTPAAQAVPMPSGWQAGDLLLLFVAQGVASNSTTVTWSGATQVGNPLGGSDEFTSLWYKIATSSEAPTYSTSDASSRSSTIMAAYRNVDATTPIDTTVGFVDSPAGTTHTVPSQTVNNGTRLVSLASLDGSAGTAAPQYTQPTGWTKRVDYLNNTTDNYASALADSGTLSASTQSGHTWTSVYADRAVNVTVVALRRSGTSAPITPTVTYRVNGLTRVRVKTSDATSVRLKIGTDSTVTTGVQYTSAQTPTAEGLSLHDWSGLGLTAGQRYFYRVMMTDSASGESADVLGTVGTFKVAPTGQTSFNFCFGACTDGTDSAAMSAVAARGDDFFLHLGDLYYADASGTGAANFRSKFDAKLSATNHHSVFAQMMVSYQASDHDGGMNNNYVGSGDTTARDNYNTVYRERFPNNPVPATLGQYFAWTWGRIRFIHADERTFKSLASATDNSSKTMLGATQKQWLKDEITNATEPVIIWVGDTAWTGATTASEDHWAGYNTERQEMATFITASGKKVARIGGDMHAVAADDGTNSAAGIPVFHGAPLNNNASIKGGPYSHGPIPASGTAVVQQYGRIVVTDSGGQISLAFTGYDSANTSLVTYTKTFTIPTTASPTAIGSGEVHGNPTVATTLTTSPSGLASGEAHGTATATSSLTTSPTGIASAQVLGTPTVATTLSVVATGIPSDEAVGSPTMSGATTLTPTGVATSEAFGAVTISNALVASPIGVATGESFGNPTSTTLLSTSPTAIGNALAFGNPTISTSLTSSPIAIASTEAFGAPAISGLTTISPTSIMSILAFGTPVAGTGLTASPVAITSVEAHGNPTLTGLVTLSPVALSSAVAFGTAVVSTIVGLVPSGIATGETFGAPTASITGGGLITAQPSAIGSAEAMGLPSALSLLVVGANGISTGESVGVASASTLLPASPVGIASALAFGTTVATTGVSMVPTGIATALAFGTTVTTTLLTSSPASIASAEAFGVALANVMQNTTPTGVSSALSFGVAVANTIRNTLPSGIATGEVHGTTVITGLLVTSPSGKSSDQAFGNPTMSGRLDATAGTIGTLAAVGSPVVQTLIGAVVSGIASLQAWGSPTVTIAATSQGRDGARKPVVILDAGSTTAVLDAGGSAKINPNTSSSDWRKHDGDYGAWFTQA